MSQKKLKWPKIRIGNWINHFKRPKFKLDKLKLEHPANWLENFVTILLRLGTLFLVLLLIIFFVRIFNVQGYVMEPFNVPSSFDESGYSGFVVARKIQDKVFDIKETVSSVKEDSVILVGDEQPELDLKVLGVGVSLRSLVYQMRSLLSQKNKSVQGEIIAIDDQYELTLRMTGYPPQKHTEKILDGDHKGAINRLIKKGGELILINSDPYRIALLCYQEKRYKEAVNMVRKIIKERPQEIHWAYLAWGSILEDQGEHYTASFKFRRAIELKPDFSLGYTRLGWNLSNQNKKEEAIKIMRKAVYYDPKNIGSWLNLAWLHHSNQNYSAADSAFQTAVALAPTSIDPLSSWADSKISRGKPEEALPLIQEAEQYAQENARGYLVRALGSLAKGDSLEAFNHVMTALDFDPQNPIAILEGINALWMQKEYSRIIAVYQNSDIRRMGDYQKQRILNIVAMSYNYDNQFENALKTIEKAIKVNKNVSYPYTTLAEIYALSGDFEKFYKYLEIALEKGFDHDYIEYDLEPYQTLKGDRKYQDLIGRYQKKKIKG